MVFPFITYINVSAYNEAEKNLFGGYNGMSIDFFIYHKQILLIGMALMAVLWFIGERVLPQKVDNNVPLFKGKNKGLFILMGVFSAGLVVSTLFSDYQENAISGLSTEGEGLWTLLAYIVLILSFYNAFANEYGMNILKRVMTILGSVTVLLTMVEWFYKPVLEIGLVQALVAPSRYAQIMESVKATTFDSAISVTFHNPGYFGGFVCMLLPFILGYGLNSKKVVEKVLYGVLSSGLLFGVVTTNTTTAMYIAILEVVLISAIYVFSSIVHRKSKKTVAVLGAGVVVLAIGALILSGVITGNSFLGVLSNENSVSGNKVETRFEITDIQMKDNQLLLVGKEETLEMNYINKKLVFKNSVGKELPPTYTDGKYRFLEPGFENIAVQFAKASDEMKDTMYYVLVDAGYQDTIDFQVLQDGTFAGVGQGGAVLTDIGDAGTPETLKSYYGLFTGRGYAWINSLPIIKETLLIGKGPGNFPYYFKQFDYMGMLQTHETMKKIVDKPHNAYIQYGVNLGIPAMIAFFGIFAMVLCKAVKSFVKNGVKHEYQMTFHMAGMVALAGFLLYSLINDSMVTVTPVACMIAGAVLASCYMSENAK